MNESIMGRKLELGFFVINYYVYTVVHEWLLIYVYFLAITT